MFMILCIGVSKNIHQPEISELQEILSPKEQWLSSRKKLISMSLENVAVMIQVYEKNPAVMTPI